MKISFIVTLVVSFVLRGLGKYAESLDWEKVKENLEPRIRKLIPGEIFDELTIALVNRVLDETKKVVTVEDNMKQIAELLAAGKFKEALIFVEGIVLHKIV